MNSPIDQEIENIARRIRDWREEDKLTLQELAKRSGVATSTIQKIETGQMMPSVAVLLKVARGLGRRIADLVGDESVVTDLVHLAPHERQTVCVGDNLFVERLTGDLHKPGIEMWRVTLHPRDGLGSHSDAIDYEGEEVMVDPLVKAAYDMRARRYIWSNPGRARTSEFGRLFYTNSFMTFNI